MRVETSMGTPTGAKRRTVRNLAGNLTGFIFSIALGLWYTPYLIRHLGTTDFGLVPLATTVTSYLSLLTIALTHSLARFLTIAVERGDNPEASRIFNTALFGGLALVTIVVLPAAVLVFSLSTLARVPTDRASDVTVLFALTVAGFLLTVAFAPFNISTWVKNRLDLRTGGDILYNLVRVSTVAIFFRLLDAHLWQVGVGLCLAGVVSAVYSIGCSRLLLPSLRIRLRDAHWGTFKDLYRTSSWVIVDQLGAILCGGLDLLLANRLLGARSGGQYAVVLQWVSLLRSLGTTFASVLAPTVVALFAKNEIESLTRYTLMGMRLVGLFMALPIGLLCGLSGDLLRLWVGPSFGDVSILMRIVIAPLSIVLAATPLIYVLMATNAVRVPALWTVGMGVVDVLLIFLFTERLGLELYGIALASLVAVLAKNALFLPLYVSMQIKQPVRQFLRPLATSIAATAMTGISSYLLARLFVISTWIHLGIVALLTAVLFCTVVYVGLLNAGERSFVRIAASTLLPRFAPDSL